VVCRPKSFTPEGRISGWERSRTEPGAADGTMKAKGRLRLSAERRLVGVVLGRAGVGT
jgi:hypothetical protein